MFRNAGYRILYDVPLHAAEAYDFTADGYDPERGVGFEYLDPNEYSLELDTAEKETLARLQKPDILIVEPSRAPAVLTAAETFLQRVE